MTETASDKLKSVKFKKFKKKDSIKYLRIQPNDISDKMKEYLLGYFK